ECAAGPILGFQDQHPPSLPGQRGGAHQPIGPRPHHDRIPTVAQELSPEGSQSWICCCTSSSDNWSCATWINPSPKSASADCRLRTRWTSCSNRRSQTGKSTPAPPGLAVKESNSR